MTKKINLYCMKCFSCGIYFLLSFFIVSCKYQKVGFLENKRIVPDSIKYEFINYFINTHDTINISDYKFIADRDTARIPFPKKDSVSLVNDVAGTKGFSREDGIFIWKQMDEYYNFVLSASEIKDRMIISTGKWKNLPRDDYWYNIYNTYKADKFCSISMPLFSKDLLTVVISINGYYDNYGKWTATWVYKKIEGKWIFFDQLAYGD